MHAPAIRPRLPERLVNLQRPRLILVQKIIKCTLPWRVQLYWRLFRVGPLYPRPAPCLGLPPFTHADRREISRRIAARYQQMIASTGAGDVKQMALGVIHSFQIGVATDLRVAASMGPRSGERGNLEVRR